MRENSQSVSVYRVILLLAIMLGAISVGIYFGGHPASLPAPVRDLLVDDQVAVQAEALDAIERRFYKPVNGNRVEAGALDGMVASLDDRFSMYLDKKHYTLVQESTSGKFSGVGLVVSDNRRGLYVSEVYEGSPAEKSGIKSGDVIVAVNGRSTVHEKSELVVAKIRGKVGTKVRLSYIGRSGRRRSVLIERATIDVPLTESRLITRNGKKLGVVSLSKFSDGAAADIAAQIKKLRKRGTEGMVLDLQGNPGGLLRESIAVASLFIKDGVIVSTKGRSQKKKTYYATGKVVLGKEPLVLLVDGHSASASEIVAGALKDRGRATVVGARTYGKGAVQVLMPLTNGGALDLTVERYFTPDGFDLSGKGVKPNLVLPKRASEKKKLDVALSVLSKKIQR